MFSFSLIRVGLDFDGVTDAALEAGLRSRISRLLDVRSYVKMRRGQRVDYVEVNEEGGAVVGIVDGGIHYLD